MIWCYIRFTIADFTIFILLVDLFLKIKGPLHTFYWASNTRIVFKKATNQFSKNMQLFHSHCWALIPDYIKYFSFPGFKYSNLLLDILCLYFLCLDTIYFYFTEYSSPNTTIWLISFFPIHHGDQKHFNENTQLCRYPADNSTGTRLNSSNRIVSGSSWDNLKRIPVPTSLISVQMFFVVMWCILSGSHDVCLGDLCSLSGSGLSSSDVNLTRWE